LDPVCDLCKYTFGRIKPNLDNLKKAYIGECDKISTAPDSDCVELVEQSISALSAATSPEETCAKLSLCQPRMPSLIDSNQFCGACERTLNYFRSRIEKQKFLETCSSLYHAYKVDDCKRALTSTIELVQRESSKNGCARLGFCKVASIEPVGFSDIVDTSVIAPSGDPFCAACKTVFGLSKPYVMGHKNAFIKECVQIFPSGDVDCVKLVEHSTSAVVDSSLQETCAKLSLCQPRMPSIIDSKEYCGVCEKTIDYFRPQIDLHKWLDMCAELYDGAQVEGCKRLFIEAYDLIHKEKSKNLCARFSFCKVVGVEPTGFSNLV
jgi:hypothetical protein